MLKQVGIFAVAVAVVLSIFFLVLLSPRTSASDLTATGAVDRGLPARPVATESAGLGQRATSAPGSWSRGISVDAFTRLASRRTVPTPRPTAPTPTPAATPAPAASVIPIEAPDTSATSDPLPAGSMSNTLSTTVPVEIRRWAPSIVKYAQQNGVDPNLVAAMIMTESQGNPNAKSSRGAVGLMQVVNGTAEPDTNIAQGTKILAANLQHYGGDVELGLAAYNAGAGAVDQFGGVPPYLETETYVYLVLNRYYLYQTG